MKPEAETREHLALSSGESKVERSEGTSVIIQLSKDASGRIAEILGDELLQDVRVTHSDWAITRSVCKQAYSDFDSAGFNNIHPRHLFELAKKSFDAESKWGNQVLKLREKLQGNISGALELEETAKLLQNMVTNLRNRENGQQMDATWYEEVKAFVKTFMEQCRTKLNQKTWVSTRLNLLTSASAVMAALEEMEQMKKSSASVQ